MRVTLAARLDRDRLDLALEGRCALRVGVCVLRAEDDEADADGGLPWVLAEDEEDPLVAVDHGGRDLDLACLGRRATANLVRGECDFEDVDASAFAASDAEWLVVDVVDPEGVKSASGSLVELELHSAGPDQIVEILVADYCLELL